MDKLMTMFFAAILAASMSVLPAHAARPVDNDTDGYKSNVDCDDNNPDVNPGAVEICNNGVDDDCDGAIDMADTDCDVCTPTENPEVSCSDGVDNDCDGAVDAADSDCGTTSNRDVIVMASNDLGMHCACPGADYMLLLPPFNTLRAQVIERGVLTGGTPKVLSDPADIRVEYNIVENTDASLQADPYYSTWMTMMPQYGFGPALNSEGKIQGLTGSTLDGEMHAQAQGWWEVVGVPAYPDVSSNSTPQQKVMLDPLGGPDRNPYLTGNIKVIEQATGALLAETNITVPVAFGGCCECHLQLASDRGYPNPTPLESFTLMGALHERDSGINFANPSQLDPNNDGLPGPVRCSVCHWDPAMGESSAPGGYVDPGTGANLPVSQYSFSDVLHRWHVQNPEVLTYDVNLATDCYQCHPGNNVDCFRGTHLANGLWCTDCHGDLNQRIADGQLSDPWSGATLPKCGDCHSGTGEGGNYLNVFGGDFLNSMGHKSDAILCSTCHGAPHSLNPSTFAKDNQQNIALQGLPNPIGVCDTCHVGKSSNYSKPMH